MKHCLAAVVLCVLGARTAYAGPNDHGIFDNGAFPPAASGIVTIDLLSSALAPYLTQTQAAATYLPLAALAQPVTFGSSITANGDVTANGNVTASKNVSVKGNVFVAGVLTNSAAYNASQTWTGQGFGIQWNLAAGGIGATEFINVNPGVRGGFTFYDITMGTTISSGTRPLLSMSWSGGTVFGGLTGTGNAYACLDTNGKLYRSASACQ